MNKVWLKQKTGAFENYFIISFVLGFALGIILLIPVLIFVDYLELQKGIRFPDWLATTGVIAFIPFWRILSQQIEKFFKKKLREQ